MQIVAQSSLIKSAIRLPACASRTQRNLLQALLIVHCLYSEKTAHFVVRDARSWNNQSLPSTEQIVKGNCFVLIYLKYLVFIIRGGTLAVNYMWYLCHASLTDLQSFLDWPKLTSQIGSSGNLSVYGCLAKNS